MSKPNAYENDFIQQPRASDFCYKRTYHITLKMLGWYLKHSFIIDHNVAECFVFK